MIGTSSIHPPLALQWIDTGKIRPESIITHLIPLEDIVPLGFALLAGKDASAIKILVEF
jgi:threonine dehydrogenase-like Zn-dependent dehydrogenase